MQSQGNKSLPALFQLINFQKKVNTSRDINFQWEILLSFSIIEITIIEKNKWIEAFGNIQKKELKTTFKPLI